MKKLVLLMIAIILFVALSIAQAKIVTSSCDPWPPFVDPDHPKLGLSIEIVREAFKTQGYKLKHEFKPWARAEDGVKKGKYDILPNTWKTDKRLKYLKYSNPYATNKIKFVSRKGDTFEYKGLKSLKGKKIGVIRGYGYGDVFMKARGYKLYPLADFIQNVKKLNLKRIDLTLEDEIVARNLISKKDPELIKGIRFTKNALSSNDLYVTCGLANPRHKEIINAFNKGLKKIKANGTLKKIFKSYGLK